MQQPYRNNETDLCPTKYLHLKGPLAKDLFQNIARAENTNILHAEKHAHACQVKPVRFTWYHVSPHVCTHLYTKPTCIRILWLKSYLCGRKGEHGKMTACSVISSISAALHG